MYSSGTPFDQFLSDHNRPMSLLGNAKCAIGQGQDRVKVQKCVQFRFIGQAADPWFVQGQK
jgi:hypothetical protein